MWLMLQQDQPDDFVVATGESHSVREWVIAAFECVGLDWEDYVRFDERYMRPAEVDHLLGDPTKAYEKLGWRARTSFKDLVRVMLQADLDEELGCEASTHHLALEGVLA